MVCWCRFACSDVPVVVETLNRCELGYQVHFASMFFAFAPQTLCKVLIHSFIHSMRLKLTEGNQKTCDGFDSQLDEDYAAFLLGFDSLSES